MQKNHWTNFLSDTNAIMSIFHQDDNIPSLRNILIENITLGFNLNSLNIHFQFPVPKNPPRKYILKKYNTIIGDLYFSNISVLNIEKSELYNKEERYDFFFDRLDKAHINIQIKGSLGSKLEYSAEFFSLLNFQGSHI